MPPFGPLYGQRVFVDSALAAEKDTADCRTSSSSNDGMCLRQQASRDFYLDTASAAASSYRRSALPPWTSTMTVAPVTLP
jgi:hypothetical protein